MWNDYMPNYRNKRLKVITSAELSEVPDKIICVCGEHVREFDFPADEEAAMNWMRKECWDNFAIFDCEMYAYYPIFDLKILWKTFNF